MHVAGKFDWLRSRGGLLAACALIFLAVILHYAGDWSPTILSILFNDGLFTLFWTLAAAATGRVLLRRARVNANGLLMFSTSAALGLGLFSLAALGLGLAGCLNRATAVLLPMPGVFLWAKHFLQTHRKQEVTLADVGKWLNQPAGMHWCWIIPAVLFSMATVAACLMPVIAWRPDDPHPYDVLSYHLQVPREWFEAGRIMPLAHNVFSYFPFNVEMQYLLFMHIRSGLGGKGGAWEAMYVAQFLSVAYAVLMVMAIAASVGRAAGGIIGAALAATVPWVVMLACVAYVESAMMLYGTLAIIWAMRAATISPISPSLGTPGEGRGGGLFLAGVLAGLACGVKITCVPMLLIAIAVSLIVTNLSRPRILLSAATIILTGSLVLSPWLIRNLIWTGNPLFPVGMHMLSAASFTPEQVDRFVTAHSPRPDQTSFFSRLSVAWRDCLANWEYGYILLPLSLASAAIGVRRRNRRTIFLIVTGAFVFITWIGFTHLLGRFLVLAIPIAALLIAQLDWDRTTLTKWIGAALIAIAGTISALEIDPRLSVYCQKFGRAGTFGMRDTSFAEPPELTDQKNAGRTIALVGGAEAFLFNVPMSQLKYRTVFDLPATDSPPRDMAELVRDWLGPEADVDGKNWLIVVNPLEVRRLSATYKHVANLPADYSGPEEQAYLIDGRELFGGYSGK